MSQEGKNITKGVSEGASARSGVEPEAVSLEKGEGNQRKRDLKKAYKKDLLASRSQSAPPVTKILEKPKLAEIQKEDLEEMLRQASTLKEAKEIYDTFGSGVMTGEEFNATIREKQKERSDMVASLMKDKAAEEVITPEIPTETVIREEAPPEVLPQEVVVPLAAEEVLAETPEPEAEIPVVNSSPQGVVNPEDLAGEKHQPEPVFPEAVEKAVSDEPRAEKKGGLSTESYMAIREGLSRAIEILRQKGEILQKVLESPKLDEAFLAEFFSGSLKLDPEEVQVFLGDKDKKDYIEQVIQLTREGADSLEDIIQREDNPLGAFMSQVEGKQLWLSRDEVQNILKGISKKRVSLVLGRAAAKAKTEAAEEIEEKTRRQVEEIKMVRGALGIKRRSGKRQRGGGRDEEEMRARILGEEGQLSGKELKSQIQKGLAKYEEEKSLAEEFFQRLVAEPEELNVLKESLMSAGAYEEARELERQVTRMKEAQERKKKYEKLLPQILKLWEGPGLLEGRPGEDKLGLKEKIKEFLSGEKGAFENIRDELTVLSGLLGEFEKAQPGYRPPFVQFYTGERFRKKNVHPMELPTGVNVNIGERLGLKPEEPVTLKRFQEAVRASAQKDGRHSKEKELKDRIKEQLALVGEATRAIIESIPTEGDQLAIKKSTKVFDILEELQFLKAAIEKKSLPGPELENVLKSVARRIKLIFATDEELQRIVEARAKSGRFVPLSALEREEKNPEKGKKKGKKKSKGGGEESAEKKTTKRRGRQQS